MRISSTVLDHITDEHHHRPALVYPTLAAGVAVTGGAAWVLGAFVQIVPASTITERFDIHSVSVENLDTNASYELVLYQGAADVEVGRVRFDRSAANQKTVNVPMQTPIIDANARIRAKLGDSAGGSVATISLRYHTYT